MLQSLLQLLDMGLSSTLSREVTCFRAGVLSEHQMNSLVQTLAAVFISSAVLTASAIYLFSGWIASSWLHSNTVAPVVLSQCIFLMGIAASLRWVSGLYRSILTGSEELIWLSRYNVAIATVRYIGVLAVFAWISVEPVTFFLYQLLVSLLELSLLWYKAGKILPAAWTRPAINLAPLKNMWRFSGALAVCTILWVFVTQTDKLILSKTLALADYGYYTVAIMVANGVVMVSTPISAVLLPRLTYLFSQSDIVGFQLLYRKTTQLISVVVWPIAGAAAFFAEPLLLAWTKNTTVAHQAAPVLFWYALGNALIGIGAFQFYMQYAYGQLRLHIIGTVVFILILMPSVIWASLKFGAVGAARVWFVVNLLSLFIWSWIVHVRFAPGLHWRWLGRDVLPIAFSTLAVIWISSQVVAWSNSQAVLVGQLLSLGILALTAAALSSTVVLSRLRLLLVPARNAE